MITEWGEHIDDWGNEDYDDFFSDGEENLDNFDDTDDDDLMEITEIDFSNISGKTNKEKFKKITRKTKAKIVPKKKRLSKPTQKTRLVIPPANKKETIRFKNPKGKEATTQIRLPYDREMLITGVNDFILTQDDRNNAQKKIGYYKGEKLSELVLVFNNTTPNDFDIELFNPSSPLDFLYSTSQNLNNQILVNGSTNVSYSDLLFNLLANPTIIPNAKFVVAGLQKQAQINQPMIFRNKNISSFQKIFPIQNALNIDIDQTQDDILYWNIEETLNRVFIPDGMDTMKYKVLAGMSVIFGFYYKQVQLKKVFWEEARNKGIL
jgi:hypothetical protein